MGRPVFQNDHGQVLWVGHSSWIVTDREVMWQKGKVKRNMVMVNSGGIAHVCPGNKKAKWWYLDKSKRREDETMEVTLSILDRLMSILQTWGRVANLDEINQKEEGHTIGLEEIKI